MRGIVRDNFGVNNFCVNRSYLAWTWWELDSYMWNAGKGPHVGKGSLPRGMLLPGYTQTWLPFIVNVLVQQPRCARLRYLNLPMMLQWAMASLFYLDVLCALRLPDRSFVIQTADIVGYVPLFLLLVLASSALSCCYPRPRLTAVLRINQDKQC